MSERDGSGFLWFLAGLGIGAAVGILYAPKSGDETRQRAAAFVGKARQRRMNSGPVRLAGDGPKGSHQTL